MISPLALVGLIKVPPMALMSGRSSGTVVGQPTKLGDRPIFLAHNLRDHNTPLTIKSFPSHI